MLLRQAVCVLLLHFADSGQRFKGFLLFYSCTMPADGPAEPLLSNDNTQQDVEAQGHGAEQNDEPPP
jgi:hypothetical protein